MTLLADGLAARGHQVYLLTLSGVEEEFFVPGSSVNRVRLDLAGESTTVMEGLWANMRRIRAIRRKIGDVAPDAVLSFTTTVNILALIACAGTRVPVFVSERVDPRGHLIRFRWSVLRHLAYRRARALVTQTAAVAAWYRRRLPARVLVAAISNPVVLGNPQGPATVTVPAPFILAAGRLVHQKGFDLLIEAFALAVPECGHMHLAIAGEGPEADALARLARQCKVAERTFFLGRVSRLGALMSQAHAFVLSSRYEGFPNVLVEALAAGVPVVATDCPSGPREILCDGRHGLLVPPENPRALSAALARITTDLELRRRLSAGGPTAVSRYEFGAITGEWERLLAGRGNA